MLTHAPWDGIPGLRHGFLDRHECPGRASLQEILSRVGGSRPVTVPRQVHGTRVVSVSPGGPTPEADGLATGGEPVGIVTADCVPVLLVDVRRRVAAAVHAGWRGASTGVLEAAVAHLGTAFGSAPSDLEAAIGPAVGPCCYEVGPEVAEAFRRRTGERTGPAWARRSDKLYLDLRAAARHLLLDSGVAAASVLGPCTACDSGYHSYRRDGAATGRQLSFVGWS